VKIGVLALQGAFATHAEVLRGLGAEARELRTVADVDGVDALVLPGGESTTMSLLLDSSGLREPVGELLRAGLPALGTCAGMILLASSVLDGRADQRSFDVLDVDVRRNAFGRQIDSFESDIDVLGLDGPPFHAVFIRAPVVVRAGAEVDVLAAVDGKPVLVRHGSVVAAAFHPELSGDDRIHRLFLEGV
jgi:5'-phosphate synthase pdxT subunit